MYKQIICLDYQKVLILSQILSYVAGAVKLRNDLDLRAAQVRAEAWAPNTWRTKSSQWKKYVLFCSKIAVPALPTDTNIMCRYIVSLEGVPVVVHYHW